jgi:hypothetical protein
MMNWRPIHYHPVLSVLSNMSVSFQSSFLIPISSLSDDDKPVVACRIQPTMSPTGVRRTFHLAAFLDKSGSMGGDRMTGLQRTLDLLIDAIPEGDVLTLVPYDNASTILAKAVVITAESRVTLKAAVQGLRADGGTSLESALLLLRAEVTSKPEFPPIDSLFILTDGEINDGVSSSSGLRRLLYGSTLPDGAVVPGAVPPGTPVNTLGLGEACNARLLRALAEPNRGVYTYADTGEVLPSMVANVMTGLATEVGRNGRLAIPTGWTCLELGEHTTEALVGSLVHEKDEWVVLQGPAKRDLPVVLPTLTFTWVNGTAVHTVTAEIEDAILPKTVAEQLARCRVATVFQAVTELLELGNPEEATAKLTALNAELATSLAKEEASVLRYMAQVDENLELLRAVNSFEMGGPPLPPGLRRMGGGFLPPRGPPSMAPVLSRMHSNTSAVSTQRGFFSRVSSNDPTATVTFSSPHQANTSRTMSSQYSQQDPSCSSTPPHSPIRPHLTAVTEADTLAGTTNAFPVGPSGNVLVSTEEPPVTPPRTLPNTATVNVTIVS